MNPELEFLLKQYEALRKEIENKITVGEHIAISSVVATAVVWSWFLSNDELPRKFASFQILVFLIPVIAVVLFWLRASSLRESIEGIGRFISEIENRFTSLGWELRHQSSGGIHPDLKWHKKFWIVLLILNIFSFWPFYF